jgi:hypothetical protein
VVTMIVLLVMVVVVKIFLPFWKSIANSVATHCHM